MSGPRSRGSARTRPTSSSSPTRSRPTAAREALRIGREGGARTVLNPAPADGIDRTMLSLADVVTPNRGELARLAAADSRRSGRPDARAARTRSGPRRPCSRRRPRARAHGRAFLVSLGSSGAVLVPRDGTPVDIARAEGQGGGRDGRRRRAQRGARRGPRERPRPRAGGPARGRRGVPLGHPGGCAGGDADGRRAREAWAMAAGRRAPRRPRPAPEPRSPTVSRRGRPPPARRSSASAPRTCPAAGPRRCRCTGRTRRSRPSPRRSYRRWPG